ncbi:hypothetical protein DYB25_011701 [Aphanomyces astaci]|uniref:Uncharacterized protein n=1 Tax=Aphanomyces astaci TaxID=112090 RepID=A0A397BS63_APHAT|nr:hypothetical protein DYB25_011701 [Aphanomyces astaci]
MAASVPLPSEEPAAAQATEDVAVGFDDAVKILNAPALSQPPKFKGSTKSERRSFMREYQRYTQIMASQSTGQRPFFMPSYGDVTEDEWVAWFMESHDEEPVELDALKKRLQVAVQFDTKILDADSRVRRMLHSLMKTLAVDGQDWVLHQEGKLVVGIITKVIQPAPLQLAVTKQLQL